MNLFARTKDRRVLEHFRMQKIESGILQNISDYARGLKLPEPEHAVQVEWKENLSTKARMQAPYCLLFLADADDLSLLNAGYMVGQMSVYLHFLGFSSYIPREIPVLSGREYHGKVCVGMIAFGVADPDAHLRRMEDTAELPCICRNLQERWVEEVLTLAKKRFHISASNVRIVREENQIYFAPKFRTGKRGDSSKFETGITIAYALAAAEELWVDLVLSRDDGGRSVCLRTA